MYRFGSHISCAGGLLLAIQRAGDLQCQCLQIFVSSPRAWPTVAGLIPLVTAKSGKKKTADAEVPDEDPTLFRSSLAGAGLEAPIAHACYLINLASPDESLRKKSIEALIVEWSRADQLLLDGIVLHPGSHTTSKAEEGLANIVQGVEVALKRVQPKRCRLLLENTAGQGSCLGWQIEQLGWLLSHLASPSVGVCWDTCHALAAGYDFRTPQGMESMVELLQSCGVMEQISAVHANDSVKDCGSRVDRHEHIGLGCIGPNGWPSFLKSPQFCSLPMYLETEKGVDESGADWDLRNLAALRAFSK